MLKVKKLSSVLAIYLTISLSFAPFINAEIFSAQAVGVDNAPGYIKSNDTIAIKTSSLLPMNINFEDNSTLRGMNCDESKSPIPCEYSYQVKNVLSLYNLNVVERSSGFSENLKVYVDNLRPAIESVQFRNLNWGVEARYNIIEKANNEALGKCSGVKKVDLYLNGKLSGTSYHNISVCDLAGSVNGTIPGTNGTVNASITVTDYIGNSITSAGGTYLIESKAPRIATNAQVFLAGTIEKITTLAPNSTVPIDILVSISEENLEDEVFANLSGLGVQDTVFAAGCTGEAMNYSCRFTNILAKFSVANPKILVYARDVPGNLGNASVNLPITLVVPKLGLQVRAFRPGSASNITKIPGPNSTKSINSNIIVTATYDSLSKLDYLTADFSEIVGSSTNAINSSTSGSGIGEFANASVQIANKIFKSGKCIDLDNKTYSCIFNNINLKAQKTGAKINFTAFDINGGSAFQQAIAPFIIVASAGTVTSLGPSADKCIGSKCYLASGNNFVSAIIAGQSDFSDGKIFINEAKALCTIPNGTYISSAWSCNATIKGSGSLTLTGEDDYGNTIFGTGSSQIIVDGTAPQANSEFNATPECPTSSEALNLKVNVTETISPIVSIFADASLISSSNTSKSACAGGQGSSNYVCSLTISGLKDAQINTNLAVTISDLAGNELVTNIPVSICTSSDAVPNFIKSITPAGLMPRIDRKVASKVTMKVPVGLEISLADEQTFILDRSAVSCSGTPGLKNSYQINENSNNPLLMLSLGYTPAWDQQDDISVLGINCTQEFRIRHGNVKYNKPEIEKIIVKLPLINQAMGGINESFTRKVNESMMRIKELDKSIEKWQKIHNVLGNICKIMDLLAKVNAALQTLRTAALVVCKIFRRVPLLGDAIQGIYEVIDKLANVNKALNDNSANPKLPILTPSNTLGWTVKLTCAIYTCKIYDINGIASISLEYLQYRRAKGLQKSATELTDKNKVEIPAGQDSVLIDKSGNVLNPHGQHVDIEFRIVTQVNGRQFVSDPITSVAITKFDETTLNSMKESNSVLNKYFKPLSDAASQSTNPFNVQVPSSATATGENSYTYRVTSSQGNVNFEVSGKNVAQSTQIKEAVKNAVSRGIANNLRTTRFDGAVNGAIQEGSWIYDPYKSKHYDALCIPAILFNSKKEKELECKRVGCIQNMAKTGGPLEACEYDYQMHYCMYVDSAKWKLEGNINPGNFLTNLGRALLGNVVGVSMLVGYYALCHGFEVLPALEVSDLNFDCQINLKGDNKALCGIWGGVMDLNSIESMFKMEYWTGTTMITEIKGQTFCGGIA